MPNLIKFKVDETRNIYNLGHTIESIHSQTFVMVGCQLGVSWPLGHIAVSDLAILTTGYQVQLNQLDSTLRL